MKLCKIQNINPWVKASFQWGRAASPRSTMSWGTWRSILERLRGSFSPPSICMVDGNSHHPHFNGQQQVPLLSWHEVHGLLHSGNFSSSSSSQNKRKCKKFTLIINCVQWYHEMNNGSMRLLRTGATQGTPYSYTVRVSGESKQYWPSTQ